MIFASAPLKNGRNDYVFNIPASARRAARGEGTPLRRGGSGALDAVSLILRNCTVAPSSVVRSAKPAGAGPEAAGLAAMFLAVVLLAYLPALGGGLLWDDDAHVTKAALRSLHGLWRIWFDVGATQQYYPLLHSAFWVEHRLWGDSVLGYHLCTVALHAAAAWLLTLALRRLAFPAPVLAGLIFALHPICVESVAWISEQKNTLSAVFYLGSALLYLRFDATRSRGHYAGAAALFIMALLTKSVTATLPAALLVVFWWRRGRLSWRGDVLPLLPWLLVGIAGGLFTAHVEARVIGAEGPDFSLTFLQRLLVAGRAIAFYAGKVVWPRGLAFVYPRWQVDPGDVLQFLYPAGVLALLAALLVLAQNRRGPLAGFLFFSGTLFPVLGFVNVYPFIYSFVADHFQYLASLGIIVPLAWAFERTAARVAVGPRVRACLILVVPAVLGVLSWRQCAIYRDSDTLNRATLLRNPSAWRAHYDLGVTLGRTPGRLGEAISEYEATLRLKPDYWAAHSNLGSALLRMPGRTADAIAEYEAALRLNPDFADAHSNLGVALGRVPGRLPEGIEHVRAALRIRPDDDGILDNLGALLMRLPGSSSEAIADFEAAIRLSPGNPEYHYNLANALAATPGRLNDAVAEYRAAIRLEPGFVEAHSNLGAALDRLPGQVPAAISEYEAALRLSPGNAHLHQNLANALARTPGRAADAVAEFQAALKIDPDDALAHNGLGVVLAVLPGRLPEAVSEFATAVRLKPDFALAHYCLAIAIVRTGGPRDQAIVHLRTALQLQPDFKLAEKALGQLQAESTKPR
jgi:tetratricopeptide (TPR) repeat protein